MGIFSHLIQIQKHHQQQHLLFIIVLSMMQAVVFGSVSHRLQAFIPATARNLPRTKKYSNRATSSCLPALRKHTCRNNAPALLASSSLLHRKTLTALYSSTNPGSFQGGDRVQVEVDGAQYEGFVQGKKSGWYTIMILDEGDTYSIVKKRSSQLSLMKTDSSDAGKESIEQIPELIDQTLDAPTIVNLDASLLCQENNFDITRNKRDRQYLKQCEHFAKYDKWVTFTDLHCAPNTINTCLNVLTKVHAEAKRQNAGVRKCRICMHS